MLFVLNLFFIPILGNSKPSGGGGGGGGGGGPMDIKAALAARGRGGGGNKFKTVASRPTSGSHAPIPAFGKGSQDDNEGM